jgi:hypothetical protein
MEKMSRTPKAYKPKSFKEIDQYEFKNVLSGKSLE